VDLSAGIVVGFAGGIGSGKTSLSQAVALDLYWPWVSFGDYVRSVAANRGSSPDRRSLQLVGESLIQEGWSTFCAGVLNQANWKPGQDLVVDGVRHAAGVRALRSLVTPSQFCLVGILLDPVKRWEREGGLTNIDAPLIRSIEGHSTEAEVGSKVMALADLVVDGSRPLEELIPEVANWLAVQ